MGPSKVGLSEQHLVPTGISCPPRRVCSATVADVDHPDHTNPRHPIERSPRTKRNGPIQRHHVPLHTMTTRERGMTAASPAIRRHDVPHDTMTTSERDMMAASLMIGRGSHRSVGPPSISPNTGRSRSPSPAPATPRSHASISPCGRTHQHCSYFQPTYTHIRRVRPRLRTAEVSRHTMFRDPHCLGTNSKRGSRERVRIPQRQGTSSRHTPTPAGSARTPQHHGHFQPTHAYTRRASPDSPAPQPFPRAEPDTQ
ncbi:hypothetical protein NONI108955_06850 [Nocardia ninae]